MTTEQKVLEMISAARKEHPTPDNYLIARTALCRAIEQHEEDKAAHVDQLLVMDALTTTAETQREAAKQELNDFKQKVSDIVEAYVNVTSGDDWKKLKALIIPAPKPDPLVDVAKMMGYFNTAANAWAGDVRAALEARGLEIREKNDD